VVSSSQSNGGSPEREPTRAGNPRAASRSATRRPVLPVPPTTNVVLSWVFPASISRTFSVSIACSFSTLYTLSIDMM
jgi:hypothetical protein